MSAVTKCKHPIPVGQSAYRACGLAQGHDGPHKAEDLFIAASCTCTAGEAHPIFHARSCPVAEPMEQLRHVVRRADESKRHPVDQNYVAVFAEAWKEIVALVNRV